MRKSIGEEIIEGLTELAEALESGAPVGERFTCRRVVLDLEPTPYSPELVRRTRDILGASQAVFAQFLGVSIQTVRSWEQGVNTPNHMACRFMDEIRRDPTYWRRRFKGVLLAKRNRNDSNRQGRNRKRDAVH
jgi:putative transcriptional regulator